MEKIITRRCFSSCILTKSLISQDVCVFADQYHPPNYEGTVSGSIGGTRDESVGQSGKKFYQFLATKRL